MTYVFTGVCLSTGEVSQHALQQVWGDAIPACIAGGIPACLATGLGGGAWSGGAGIPACTEADSLPRERRLLLRTVRIPLECIIVWHNFCRKLHKIKKKQECIAVGCVPPVRYRTGGLPDRDPPGQRPPRTETPLGRDPHRQRPPGQRKPRETPPVMWQVMHAGTETPPVNRMTHRCKNINNWLRRREGWAPPDLPMLNTVM